MKRLTCLALVVLAAGCYASFAEPGDGSEDVPVVECRRNPAPECDDGDPCTVDYCSAPGICAAGYCAMDAEPTYACVHVPGDC